MTAMLRPILLAEDNGNDVELILTAFKGVGIINDITIARDGAEALDFLHRRGNYHGRTSANPALVLLDLKMPRVDGHEVLREIRETPELRTIPVVVLTSSKEENDLMQTYQLGANAYVVKPVAFAEFINAVSKVGVFWALINELPPRSSASFSSPTP
jgi:CheY-like chemotaxis protein